ncbi:MAG: signal peptidase II [Candidatus Shapirobacteria bacterium]|jgi:signal peptidase II
MFKFKGGIKTTAQLAAVVFLVVLDRLFKAWAVSFSPEINLICDWFRIVLAKNQGIAFSLPIFGRWLSIVIFLIIIFLIYVFVSKIKKTAYFETVLYSAIILGAASNLYDRLKFGYVIDYFSLKYYSVFNIADALIMFGLLGLFWLTIDKNRL